MSQFSAGSQVSVCRRKQLQLPNSPPAIQKYLYTGTQAPGLISHPMGALWCSEHVQTVSNAYRGFERVLQVVLQLKDDLEQNKPDSREVGGSVRLGGREVGRLGELVRRESVRRLGGLFGFGFFLVVRMTTRESTATMGGQSWEGTTEHTGATLSGCGHLHYRQAFTSKKFCR
jgi:hypothetical protein